MPDPKQEQGQQTPKVFSDEWRQMQNKSKEGITNKQLLDMWAKEMIAELDLGEDYKLPDGPVKEFRTKFEKKSTTDVNNLRMATLQNKIDTKEKFEDLYNLARSQIERDGEKTWPYFDYKGRYGECTIEPDRVFGWNLEAQRINQDWRVNRLSNNPQFAHYQLASRRMTVADVLDVEKRRETVKNLSADDPYWGFAYWDIKEQPAIDFYAANHLMSYLWNRLENNGDDLSSAFLDAPEFQELCRLMPKLDSEDLLRQCSVRPRPVKDTTCNTWFQEERRILSEDKANEKKPDEKLDQMAMRFVTDLAKQCEKVHDLLENNNRLMRPRLDDFNQSLATIAYASVWLHQFNTSKEPYFIDRIPSKADMGDDLYGFRDEFHRDVPYSEFTLNDMDYSLEKLIRWPSEADMAKLRWPSEADMAKLGDTFTLTDLVNEPRSTTYENGVLSKVDFKEFKELEQKLIGPTGVCSKDSKKEAQLKKCIADGTLLWSIQFESEGGRLRMTVADSLYEAFGLTPPLRTAQQKAEPQKAESQNPPQPQAKPKAMSMGGMG